MIKALAHDIDDTILNQQGELSRETIQSIAQAQEAGLHVILATARGFRSAEPIHRQLGLTEPVVCHAGALVYDYKQDAPLQAWHLPRSLAQHVAELAEQADVTLSVYVGREVWFNRLPSVPMRQDWYVKCELAKLLTDADALEMVFVGREEIAQVKLTLQDAGLLSELTLTDVDVDGQPMLFISRAQVDKTTGLDWLLSRMQVAWEQVAACGDGMADICMIKRAGFGVAVPHAKAEVQAARDASFRLSAIDPVSSLIKQVLEYNTSC